MESTSAPEIDRPILARGMHLVAHGRCQIHVIVTEDVYDFNGCHLRQPVRAALNAARAARGDSGSRVRVFQVKECVR